MVRPRPITTSPSPARSAVTAAASAPAPEKREAATSNAGCSAENRGGPSPSGSASTAATAAVTRACRSPERGTGVSAATSRPAISGPTRPSGPIRSPTGGWPCIWITGAALGSFP